MYFTSIVLCPHDLLKSEPRVSKRQSVFVSTCVKDEETVSKQLSDFPHMAQVSANPKLNAYSFW